ncbi:MAG: Type IV pilus biogenesis protein PilQ [Rhodanobacteraceae bacterium]|jgi:type IV pilus assembly protein PilQ|nr:MAG: Type IV pilus biogenesis protein PilQ [Rhodanobacteraceae bacterium]
MAANTLQNVSAAPLPGGKVQVTLTFSGPAATPQAFSTNTPPRIAMDFADTANGLSQRSVAVNQGTAESVSAVSANGRTRVVVALSQPSPYVTSVDGNKVVVTIGDGMGGATAAADPEPAQAAPALAAVPPPPQSDRSLAVATANPDKAVAMAGSNVITGVDFQRGDHGGGKLVVQFSQPGAATSMHTNGDTTTIDVAGASLAASQARRLDVTSYATPVRSVNTHAVPGGARIDVDTRGVVQTASYQTGNEYVVEFSRPSGSETTALGAPKPIVYKGSRVTFNFQDIPVRSVLQLLADVSNLNIVASDSVQGNVTLRLVNVPWDQALDVILRAKGLAKRQNGNVVWVAPQTELAKYEENIAEARQKQLDSAQLVTDYIPINYGSAQQIADLLTSGAKAGNVGGGGGSSNAERGFLSPRGSVSFDERTNTLLVNDTPEKVQEIRQLVSVLDRPVKQVLIESRLVIATDNFTRELGAKLGVGGFNLGTNSKHAQVYGGGINGVNGTGISDAETSIANYWNSFGGQSTGNSTVQIPMGLNVNLPSSTTGTSSFAIGILGRDYLLNLELSAAQQEGRSETISQPKVVTANNQPATIQQGQQIGYLTFQNSGAGGGQGTATVQFKNAVLELDVTPTITSDNRVFMKLKVIKDAISALVPNPGGGFVPQIDHREIDTSVLVGNGQTVVLGGVYEFTNEHDVTKVPFLGDIPILGALFRDKKNVNNKAELLVFITPHILGQETTVE